MSRQSSLVGTLAVLLTERPGGGREGGWEGEGGRGGKKGEREGGRGD